MNESSCEKYRFNIKCLGISGSELCGKCKNHFQEDNQPVVSDGGSSSYYEIPLPRKVIDRIVSTGNIEVKDLVRYGFGNDFDCGNIIKATKRIYESKQGRGKQGVDVSYDANKIKFFTEELING